MSDQATPQRDTTDDKQHGTPEEVSDQNREEGQETPDHGADRPTDPAPGDEAA